MLLDEYGLKIVLHLHGDSHIETSEVIGRIFDATDPTYVNLCLDPNMSSAAAAGPGGSSRPTGGWCEACWVGGARPAGWVAAVPVGGNGVEIRMHVDRLSASG